MIKRLLPLFWLLSSPFSIPLEESGERHLFLATSGAYPSRDAEKRGLGAGGLGGGGALVQGGVVPLINGLGVKRASVTGADGKGNGVYRTKADGETFPDKKVLVDARKEGLDVAGWRETVKVFERVLGEGALGGAL